jgi:hypothetical protein
MITGALILLGLAACGGSSSPTGTAAGILGKTGATASSPAYMVTSGSQGNGPVCDAGSAEADGGIGTEAVTVCVFPSNTQLKNDAARAVQGGDGATIQVGQLILIYAKDDGWNGFELSTSGVDQLVSRTGGTLLSNKP